MNLRRLIFLPICALLFSCASYVSKPGADAARLKVVGDCNSCFAMIDEKNACNPDSSERILSKDWASLYLNSGKRIAIERGFEGGWQVIVSCKVRLSFIPEAGITYISEFKIENGGCSHSIFRLTDSGDKVMEPSSMVDKKEMCLY